MDGFVHVLNPTGPVVRADLKLDAIDVELRRLPAPHRALRVAAGRAEICVNLDHAVRVDPATGATRRGDWKQHPLVADLRAVAPPRLAGHEPHAG